MRKRIKQPSALQEERCSTNRHMREGAVFRLVCPPADGFAHPRVKAESTLIYGIEVIEIVEVSR